MLPGGVGVSSWEARQVTAAGCGVSGVVMGLWKRGGTRGAGPPGPVVNAAASAGVAWGPGQEREVLPLSAVPSSVAAGWDADSAVAALYAAHYRPLVRLAELLVGDLAAAENAVQESFVAMHGRWHRLLDQERALSYLRKSVVNRSRSALRYRAIGTRDTPPAPGPGAECGGASPLENPALVAALGALPQRQREALVLRYYQDLSEAQIASAMGVTPGAVHRYTARGRSALRARLELSPHEPG